MKAEVFSVDRTDWVLSILKGLVNIGKGIYSKIN